MTVYDLIFHLVKFPPNTEVVIIPQKRNKWDVKNVQRAENVYGRGFKSMSGDEPRVEILGVPEE